MEHPEIYGYLNNTSTMSQTSGEGLLNITKDTFIEDAQSYLTFKIAGFLGKYWFIILVPIGFVGNTLSFLVMIKPNNRKISTCIYMAGISINDNIMMCLATHHWLLSGMKTHEWSAIECQVIASIVNITLQNATHQVLAMTMDKFIAIKWPHKAATYSTPRRAKFTVIIIYLCVITYNIPYVFMANLVGKECMGYSRGGVITKVYSWLTIVVNALIPFALLIYMNGMIVKKVRQSREMFGGNDSAVVNNSKGQGQFKGQSDSNVRRQKVMKSAESQLTVMLLMVTTLFLILMIPTYIRFLYVTFLSVDTPSQYASVKLFFHVTHKLYNTNSGINFFLYCISGTKFRNDLKEILSCFGRRSQSLTDSGNSSNPEQKKHIHASTDTQLTATD